jgi:hypothetical protein
MITSASAMALPILAVRHSSFSMSTSRCSFPHSPSAMITSQPTARRLKPFSMAEFKWSTALALFPMYRVLQSVRKGLPPLSLMSRPRTAARLGRTNARLPGSPMCSLIATILPSGPCGAGRPAQQPFHLLQQVAACQVLHVVK